MIKEFCKLSFIFEEEKDNFSSFSSIAMLWLLISGASSKTKPVATLCFKNLQICSKSSIEILSLFFKISKFNLINSFWFSFKDDLEICSNSFKWSFKSSFFLFIFSPYK
ncbi:hypothetical protein MFC_01409 [Mesomycoplasma flocculare ATCC 27716]|nr:hypothetical protein MFC_01409 [Mesomycoplasma flocculare ATCC 27716]